MRVLFWIEPLVMHSRPMHYWAWLDYSVRAARALASTGRGYTFRFAMNEALATRALEPAGGHEGSPARTYGLAPESIATLRQEEIRALFDAPNIDILAGLHTSRGSTAFVRAYGALVKDRLAPFEPDVVVTRTPDAQLRAAFPDALVLGTELGPFSREPYALSTFYDPLGLWASSVPTKHAEALIARDATPHEEALLERTRAHYARYFDVASPFAETEARLRKRFRRLVLLPLQFGGEPGFDLNAPMRTQGEYLLHVLERAPADVGVVIAEHPTGAWVGDHIDDETQSYVAAAYPNAIFVDWRAAPSVGQCLVRHVDYVVSVSSSIGLQALFWRKGLVSVGHGHFEALSTLRGVSAIDASVDPQSLPSREGALGWLMTRYFVPGARGLDDGAWLDAFLQRGRENASAGRVGLDFYEPAPAAMGDTAVWCTPLPHRPTVDLSTLSRLLGNGDFTAWPRGDGPFFGSGPACDGWEIVASAGSIVEVRRAPARANASPSIDDEPAADCVRITRTDAGVAPTFFLQRVPDVARLAGAFVTLDLWARSPTRSHLDAYFFQQLDSPRSVSRGTPARSYALLPKWQRLRYVATLAPVGPDEARGPRSHTEVVLALPPSAGEAVVELAQIRLVPGGVTTA